MIDLAIPATLKVSPVSPSCLELSFCSLDDIHEMKSELRLRVGRGERGSS